MCIRDSNDAGVKALTYLTDFEKTHKTTSNGFMNRGQDGFAAGKVGLYIDGSFRISKFVKAEGLIFLFLNCLVIMVLDITFHHFGQMHLVQKLKERKKRLQQNF